MRGDSKVRTISVGAEAFLCRKALELQTYFFSWPPLEQQIKCDSIHAQVQSPSRQLSTAR